MTDDAPSELRRWLAERGLSDCGGLLEQHEIDLEALFELRYEHLKEIGLSMGARLKLLKAIGQGNDRGSDKGGDPTSGKPEPGAADGPSLFSETVTERRQVTAMFCDIVGYTKLSASLDPEEVRRIMVEYWRTVETTVSAYQGYIAQHLGDGALVYFGFPRAHENDAERAIHAALALLKAAPDLAPADATGFQLRIGIATGLVVINQLGGGQGSVETLAIGQTVNLASRLQSLALPDTVVIDENTRRQVGELFVIEPLAPVAVAGFETAPNLYRVTGPKPARSRFEAQRFGDQLAILGRETEIDAAMALWDRAKEGAGQLLLIRGEPGIGKSRLTWELAQRVGAQDHEVLHFQCSPHHENSPFYPLIEGLCFLADIAPGDPPEMKLERLEALFDPSEASRRPDIAVLAGLIGVDASARFGAVAGDAQERREQAMSAVADFFLQRAETRPCLLAIEDLHWCDPTSLELLETLLARAEALPILVAVTARPDFAHAFQTPMQPVELTLERLDKAHIEALTRLMFRNEALPDGLVDLIAERTDGVPLFVEELSRTLRDSGVVRRSRGALILDQERRADAVPEGLQSILMARLDRLGPARKIAQAAACIGREFDAATLARIVEPTQADLPAALERLTASGLVIGQGGEGAGRYSFRHALVRDVAYDSLLSAERRKLHSAIAAALEAAGSHETPALPEILAHHQSNAQEIGPAIDSWRRAAVAAKLRSANHEAIAHLQSGLRLLDQAPDARSRDAAELSLLLELVAPFRAAKGFAAPEVAEATARALELADRANDVVNVVALLYNEWVYKFVTAHRDVCGEFAERILDRSGAEEQGLLRMTGLRARAATQFTAGRFAEAVESFDASLALYVAAEQPELTRAIGLDAKAAALGYRGLSLWCLGRRQEAIETIEEARRHADEIAQASTTSFVTYHEALLRGVLEREPSILIEKGRALARLGEERQFVMWRVCGKLLESFGLCLQDLRPERLEAVERYFAEFENMGLVYRPSYEIFIAELCLALGAREKGLAHIASAKRVMAESGERWNESEAHRLEGALLSLNGAADRAGAERAFATAVEIASRQGAAPFLEKALAAQSALARE